MILISVGCGGNDESATSTERGAGAADASTITAAHQEVGYPVPQAPPQKEALKRLVVKDLQVGNGPVARWGDEVTVRYVGVYYKTGKIYSQHWNYSNSFKLKRRESYGSGWDGGIQGMRVGGRRELLIPSDLLFGDGDVAYVVSLLKIRPKGRDANSYQREGPFSAITLNGGERDPLFVVPDRPAPEKLVFRELVEGTGPAAKRGDEVTIRYAGAKYASGEVLYGGRVGPYALGAGAQGAAFERGIEGMRAWGRREVIIPSSLLSDSGAVDYVIELNRLEPAKAEQEGG